MKKTWISFLIVIFLIVAVFIYSAVTGSIKAGPIELIKGLITGRSEQVEIIKDLRFPRMFVSLFSGAALSVSGVLLQSVMRNPLADAGVIGISSGASLLSLMAVTALPQFYFYTPIFAFLGGALACFLVYSLSWKAGLSPLRLILTGIAINAMFTGLTEAFVSICSYFNITINQSAVSNLTMKTWSDVHLIAVYGIVCIAVALCLSSWCNILALQDKTAKNLGIQVAKARIVISVIAVLLAAVTAAVAGVISFVGLLIPHIARRVVGSDHRVLLPFSALAGALLILTADTIGRTLVAPNEIPASTIMAVIGGPFLIVLLRRSDRINGNE
ncbi:iron ABC transporter permease [Bacillus sonorensis]|uniref:Probable heme-iron transport system permease protein IsdF n=2 Tax=Bacillus sonorensis TaxID=119858 RepID=M5PEV9_9BACI|nr:MULTISPECIES: iron ABC transporter permease [Bacillus]TWK76262.1 putative heme-iron transport system permease protein IsdF [Bacillus paralicheniformis]ASB88243.1 putative heme-iron transport system permease protein IsdF [Bacillus sonorensis]EME74992.1 iron ABC transporter membrane protein [Bacillus sonorensis L12]MBG9916097.1 ABC transporter permease [Bacillus sonorensis]MCF7617662.1 iron ABC transporter permease [Bacillus sonorensis]